MSAAENPCSPTNAELDKKKRDAIEEHNFKVQVRWLSGGGYPTRECWWHVTEITLDHLRPSPEWKKQGEDLQAAKDAEARNRKGQQEQAEHRKQANRNPEMPNLRRLLH